MAIFADHDREFMFLDYSASHKQLLIRSLRNKKKDFNIDILLKGVSFIHMPSKLQGIEIKLYEPDKQMILSDSVVIDANHKVFSIADSNQRLFYVNAMSFGVYHNQLDILESSIGRYDMHNHGEQILWYA